MHSFNLSNIISLLPWLCQLDAKVHKVVSLVTQIHCYSKLTSLKEKKWLIVSSVFKDQKQRTIVITSPMIA